MWKMIASDKADKNLSENLTDTMQHKDSGFYYTKIHGGDWLTWKALLVEYIFSFPSI